MGMTYSGNGTLLANVTAPGGNLQGCSASEYVAFPQGNIALVLRGTCSFWDKAMIAQNLGASGVLIYNDPDRALAFSGTVSPPDGQPLVSIPVLGTSYGLGAELYSLIQDPQGSTFLNMKVYMDVYTTTSFNILADTISGDPTQTVVIGSHLDGVDQGPGINDNGSGSATNLALALLFNKLKIKAINRVRFAWWGAEELGLIGSQRYLSTVNQTNEIQNIAVNLNFDMVGSSNFVRGIYNGSTVSTPGSMEVTKLFMEYYQNVSLTHILTPIGSGSDHWSFVPYGIPVGGLSTGAGGIKTALEKELFGGEINAPYDACYHQSCDTYDNIEPTVLDQMAHGAAFALEQLYLMPNLKDFLWPQGRSLLSLPSTPSSSQSNNMYYKTGSNGNVESDQWDRPLKA